MKSRVLLIKLFIVQCLFSQTSPIKDCISKIDKNARVGFLLIDFEKDSILHEHNHKDYFIPASTLKLVTTIAVEHKNDIKNKLTTNVYFDGVQHDRVFDGNIIIEGSGDPTWNSKYTNSNIPEKIVSILKKRNIDTLNGSLIFNTSLFDSIQVMKNWLYADVSNYYAALPQAFNFKDNSYDLYLNSFNSGIPTEIKSVVTSSKTSFQNQVISSDINKDLAYIIGNPLSHQKEIVGSIPKNRESFKIKGAIVDPLELVIEEVKNELKKNFISVKKIKRNNNSTSKYLSKELIETISIEDLLKITNEHSLNLFAEYLGTTLNNVSLKNCSNNGEDLTSYINNNFEGLHLNANLIHDASGMSPMNRITPYQMALILRLSWKNNFETPSLLPEIGVNGTVKNLAKKQLLSHSFRLKSGTMTGVKCYAGFIENKYGFVLFINEHYLNKKTLKSQITELLYSVDKSLK